MNWRYFLLLGTIAAHSAFGFDNYTEVNNFENGGLGSDFNQKQLKTKEPGREGLPSGTTENETIDSKAAEVNPNDITITTNETTPYNLSNADSHNFTISSGASLITTVGMSGLDKSRAITITNSSKNIINRGKIKSNVIEEAYNQSIEIGYDRGFAIFIANGAVKNGSFLDNYGDIVSKMNVAKGDATPSNNNLDVFYSGNAAYLNVNNNKGMILADFNMTAGEAYSATGKASAYAEVVWTGVGVHGTVNNNDGLIMSDFTLKAGTVTSTSHRNSTRKYCINSDTCAPARADYSGNAVAGNVNNNRAYILAESDVAAGLVKNNLPGSYGTVELLFRESGNSVLGNVINNKGIIFSSSNLVGGRASASDHIGGDFEVYSRGSSNGVYGMVENNEGLISGSASLNPQSTDVPKAFIHIEDRLSANGIYGNLKINSGTVKGFSEHNPGTKLGVTNPVYAYHSGSGVAYKQGSAIDTVNLGRIIGNRSAISIEASDVNNAQFANYGLLAGPEAFSRPSNDGLKIIPVTLPQAKNYGMYLKTDSSGNIKQIIKGSSGIYDGRESFQTPIQGSTDAYKIYNGTATGINDKIVNGVGRATGVVTLKDFAGDFQINNSIINAYHTAISYNDSRIITLKDSTVNGGGVTEPNPLARDARPIVHSVIKGDNTSNGLVVIGNTTVNGNIELGEGNDIFVYDHNNVELNGRIDLGEGAKDTFALYEFSGDGDKFLPLIKREAFHGKANNILGDKVTGQEFLGLQRGLLTLKNPGDYMDYGLYVGGQAKATFTENQDYMLKGLLNFGTISLKDNSTNDNLTIKEDAYLSGIIEKDTNFNTTSADKITVLGNLSGNAKIRIIGIGDGKPSESSKTLIMTPNDDNRYDEYFTFVEEQRYLGLTNKGRFNGSPHPWYLLSAENEWFLSPVDAGGDAGGNTGGGDNGGNTGGGDNGGNTGGGDNGGNTGGGDNGGGTGGGDGGNTGDGDGDLGGIGGDIGGGNTGGGNGGTDSGGNGGGNGTGGGNTGNGNGGNTGSGGNGGGTGTGTGSGGGSDKIELLAEIPGYISLMNIAQEIAENDIGILYSRLSKVRKERKLKAYTPFSPIGTWIRAGANKFSFNEGQIFDLSGSYESYDGGIDKVFSIKNQLSGVVGLSVGYKRGRFETKASESEKYITTAGANVDTTALAFGLYGSVFNQAGSFVNLTAKYIDYTADINAAGLHSSTKGNIFVGAIAGGHKFDITQNWSLEPMAQLDLGYIRWDEFYDGFNQVKYDDQYYASGRLGIRAENTMDLKKGFLLESWVYAGVADDVANDSKLYISYDEFTINDYGFKSEFEGGLTLKHNQNLEFHLEGGYATNFDSYDAIRGDAGLRIIW